MNQSIRQAFRQEVAKTILEDIQFRRGNYYYYLGKIEPWDPEDDKPPLDQVIEQTTEVNRMLRSGIIYAKKISPSEVSLATNGHLWTSGVVYDQWDHTIDMIDSEFYVFTDEYKVYKCLDNYGGAASTVKPTTNSINPIRLADNYLWKYLYTIPEFKRKQFLSSTSMPVQRALSDSFYNNGRVDDAVVLAGGSGYADVQLTTISVTGTTTGSGAAATITFGPLGQVTGFVISNGGTGYTKGVNVKLVGNGNGAVLTPVITAGVVTSITINAAGVGYDALTTVVFEVGGAVLYPVISRVTGEILDVTIVNPGIGYNGNPTLTLVESGTPTGSGFYPGNPDAIIQAIELNGSIDRVNILDQGENYQVDSLTSITVSGDGTGAVFSPIVYEGVITGVIVEDGGSGYTNITLTVNATLGSGAVVQGIITQSDFQSDQSYVEQSAIPGAIYNIKLTAAGANYSNSTYVTVVGNGTGCVATPVIELGQISRINITSFGSGYTYATIVITDPLRDENIIADSSKARAYAILPPGSGHGSDALSELYADTMVINTSLRNELQKFGIVQDYRTFGLIKNPKNLISGVEYISLDSLVVYQMRFQNVTALTVDEILVYSSNKYRVVNISSNDVYLAPLDRPELIPLGALDKEDGSVSYLSTETLYSLDFDKYSGTMIYVSLETPFIFSEEQSLSIKTYINF